MVVNSGPQPSAVVDEEGNIVGQGWFSTSGDSAGTPYCTDSDSKDDYFVKGTLNVYRSDSGQHTISDSCFDEYTVRELSCVNEVWTSRDGIDLNYISHGGECPKGYHCSDGACVEGLPDTDNTEGLVCKSSIPLDYYNANGPDECLDENTIKEYYCESGGELKSKTYECKYGCVEGACNTWQEGLAPRTCYDSDMLAADPIYKKGSVTIKNEVDKTDYCFIMDESYHAVESEEGEYLTEYACTEDENMVYARHKCPGGCVDGACIPLDGELAGCIDTDGGDDRFIQGSVSIDGDFYSSDICFNLGENLNILPGEVGEYVTEYSCGAFGMDFTRYKCDYGCQSGACIEEEVEE